MKFSVKGAPHVPAPTSVRWMMAQVLIALVPGILAHAWYFGPGILFQIVLATGFGYLFELACLKLRGADVARFLQDLTVPITAVLYALCLPSLAPWWLAAIGMFFAIVIAKHVYGGLGFNLFNPAMVGYAVVLVSFPQLASHWLPPIGLADTSISFSQTLATIFQGTPPNGLTWDAITQATPLDRVKIAASEGIMMSNVHSEAIFGDFGGKGWEWIANWYALGGIYLLFRRVISWHIPVATLGVVILASFPLWLFDPSTHPFPLDHVFAGGLVLGAFFIATDPVTSSTTPKGRIIFGIGVGLATLAIRRWGGYPDGVAFAVLLMNMAVPLIDRYTIPKVYGHHE